MFCKDFTTKSTGINISSFHWKSNILHTVHEIEKFEKYKGWKFIKLAYFFIYDWRKYITFKITNETNPSRNYFKLYSIKCFIFKNSIRNEGDKIKRKFIIYVHANISISITLSRHLLNSSWTIVVLDKREVYRKY